MVKEAAIPKKNRIESGQSITIDIFHIDLNQNCSSNVLSRDASSTGTDLMLVEIVKIISVKHLEPQLDYF